MFYGCYLHFVELSTLRGYYPHFVDLSAFRGYPRFVDIIHIVHITSYLALNVHFVLVVDIIYSGHITS